MIADTSIHALAAQESRKQYDARDRPTFVHTNGLTPADTLRQAGEVYDQKNAEYGDSYKQFGHSLAAMFPNGLTLNTADDFNRFAVFTLKTVKQHRYANNFTKGGHEDSLLDESVYAHMLMELDREARGRALQAADDKMTDHQ